MDLTYRFNGFRADPVRRLLFREDGARVPLKPRVFETLLYLLQHRGELVDKRTLLEAIWPGVIVEENNLNQAISTLRRVFGETRDEHRFIVTEPGRGYRFVAVVEAATTDAPSAAVAPIEPQAAAGALAVLPFEPPTQTADGEYLSDGLTETLINILVELPTLQVIARSTVFRHRGRDPLEAGRALNARAVVAGRVVQVDEMLVIGVELIDVATGAQLWGQHYRRRFADIFDIQEEIAAEISKKILTKITMRERRQIGRRDTTDHDAYRAYLRGRYHWNQRTLASIRNAAECFTAAIERDPSYASAHSGLGDALAMLGIYQGLEPRKAFPKAKAAARRALEIVPQSAEAKATLGFSALYFDWDLAAAESALLEAIELKTQYASAHQWFGMCLAVVGRTDEALAEWAIARELDPFSASINYTAAWPLYWARRTDEAIAQLEEAIALHPTFWGAHYYLGLAQAQCGAFDAALAALERARVLGDSAWLWEGIGYCYAAAGRSAEAEAVLQRLDHLAADSYVAPYSYAVIHAGLGNLDRAIDWLEEAVRDRSWRVAWITVDPFFESLRSHPRFAHVLQLRSASSSTP